MSQENPSIVTVQVHFGAEHTTFEASLSESVATVRATATNNLHVVLDPAIDYFLEFKGVTVENETQTLGQLLGPHAGPRENFHLKKRPKGGSPQ
jgi:hypothetical protein